MAAWKAVQTVVPKVGSMADWRAVHWVAHLAAKKVAQWVGHWAAPLAVCWVGLSVASTADWMAG